MAQRKIEVRGTGSGAEALSRLIGELGRAAQAGWGPTVRWLAFLVVIATAIAIVVAISR